MEYILFLPVYVPVNATLGQDSVRLFAMVGTAYAATGGLTNTSTPLGVVVNYKWNIKIRQIDCKVNDPLQGDEMLKFIDFPLLFCKICLPLDNTR